MYKRRAMFARKKVQTKTPKVEKPATKKVPVGGPKNGGDRVVSVEKTPRYYPAEDIKKPMKSRKKPGQSKLRASITPGTVLILVSGPYRGRRYVFFKQLASGLLLVTGPYKINGVPIRRVNQAYVIATSTQIDISSVKVDAKFTDEYFKAAKKAVKSKNFIEGEDTEQKPVVSEERKADQAGIDSQLVKVISKTELMKQYLASYFTLSNGVYPHAIKF